MSVNTTAAEAAVWSQAETDGTSGPAERQQGVLGEMAVSVHPGQGGSRGSPRLESGAAGAVECDSREQASLQSRQAAAIGPVPGGSGAPTAGSLGERAGIPPSRPAPPAASAAGAPAVVLDRFDSIERFLHPAGLKATLSVNARGAILFRGLRHGMLVADGLDLPQLKQLSRDKLTSLCEQIMPYSLDKHPSWRRFFIQTHVNQIRSTSCHHANLFAQRLHRYAVNHLAEEVAATALANDSHRRQRALEGFPVNLRLCAVSLLTPEEFTATQSQVAGFQSLTDAGFRPLSLRDADGVPHRIRANIKVRQFALSSVGESLESVRFGGHRTDTVWKLEQLFGPISSPGLTGEAGARVDAIDADALRSFQVPLSRALQRLQAIPGNGADHVDLRQMRTGMAGIRGAIETEMPLYTRNSRPLVEACRQLKTMWAERRDWPPGVEAHRRAAALLLLAAHQMGETPLLSGTSEAVTKQLDAEVKFLAAYADDHDGHLPPPGLRAPGLLRAGTVPGKQDRTA